METFDNNGSYNKTIWEIGDIITSEKLNKIEDALYEINNNVPTDISDLNNDAEYITESQLENYVTKTYVNEAIANIDLTDYVTENDFNQNLENYVLKSEIPNIDGIVSSNSVTRIEIVTEYPEVEELGVLYIKVSE